MSEEELKKTIDVVAGIEVHSEAEAIAKEELMSYAEQLQQENEKLKKKLFSPDQVETTCPKCGERYSINYCKEVYKLEEENKKLKEQVECLIHQRDRILINITKQSEANGDYYHILTEFEKWLEELLKEMKNTPADDIHQQVQKDCILSVVDSILNKLQELKEGKK